MNPQAVHSSAVSAKLCPMHTPKTVFGNHQMSAKRLIGELKDQGAPWSHYQKTDARSLTKKIFSDLQAIGKRKGASGKTMPPKGGIKPLELESFFTGNGRRRAFLLDFLWWRDGYGTALAVESEISERSINAFQHDFEKLLCWKSPMKLMIVRETKKLKAQTIADELTKYARKTVRQFVEHECYVLCVLGRHSPETSWFVYHASQNHCDLPKHTCSDDSEHRCFKFAPHPPSRTASTSTTHERRRREKR